MAAYRATWIEAPITGRGFEKPTLKRYLFTAESGNDAMWKALCFIYVTTKDLAREKMEKYCLPDVGDFFMKESATRKVINVELQEASGTWYEIWCNKEMETF